MGEVVMTAVRRMASYSNPDCFTAKNARTFLSSKRRANFLDHNFIPLGFYL